MRTLALIAVCVFSGAAAMEAADLLLMHSHGSVSSYVQMIQPMLDVAERRGERLGYEQGKRDYATLKSTVTEGHIRCDSHGNIVFGNILFDDARLLIDLSHPFAVCAENIDRTK